ncbi:MAG: hypothetical protein ACLUJG_08675 [Lawsonibacter sp.]
MGAAPDPQGSAPAQQETAELSGTITANGSTSMENVVQTLDEAVYGSTTLM